MRSFKDGDEIWIEPWRARAFPVIKDLVVDRSGLRPHHPGRRLHLGRTGSAPDANAIPVPKERRRLRHGRGRVHRLRAACPNASAMLFTAAKVAHLGRLPQGKPEHHERVRRMVEQMDAEGFGNCTNHYECMAACPKEISAEYIAEMNRSYIRAVLSAEE